MFLIPHFIDHGEDAYLFFWADPRSEGCTLPVVEGVTLDGLPSDGEWTLDDAEFGESPLAVLAQSKRPPESYRLCRSKLDVPMEWEIVVGSVEVWATWGACERSPA
jgi:hypothetical protein